MSPDSQPADASPPVQAKRAKRITGYWLLAIELLIILCVKGRDWAHQFQLRAALLQVHWMVLALGWLVGVPVLYFLMIAAHEAGHVLGGLLMRFRILSYTVKWLRIVRKATGWEVRLVKSHATLGGMVQATPTRTSHLRLRYLVFVVGGPGANLLTGALALYLHQRLAMHHAASAFLSLGWYLLLNALTVFGWLSLAMGALNLLPRTLKSGHIVDGKHIWQFLRGGPAMHQQLGILYFYSLLQAGQRPRDWDADLVAQFVLHRSNSVLDCYAHLLAYSYFLDCNDLAQLRHHLNLSLDSVALASASTQQHVLGEAAYVAALLTHNVEQSRYWLDRAQAAKPFSSEEGLFARAAVAYAENQFEEAESWLRAAAKQLAEIVPSGATAQAADRIHDLLEKLQQARKTPTEVAYQAALTA